MPEASSSRIARRHVYDQDSKLDSAIVYHEQLFRHLTEILINWGPLGVLLLALLDSAGIPVAGVFDGLLILIAIKSPSVAWLCASLAVAGSTSGNVILFLTARRGGRRFVKDAAPQGRAARFRSWFHRYGLITVFVPALIPIPMPLKLFVISAGALGTPLTEFVPVVLTARVFRYFGEAWLGVRLGENSTAFLKSHAWMFVLGALCLSVLLYAFMLWKDRLRRRIGV